MKYFKSIGIVTLIQIIVWIIFNLCDLLSEKIRISEICIWISIILPIIISLWYLIKEKNFYTKLQISKIKFYIIIFITWIVETAIIGSFICTLVNYNKWIIKQHHYGIIMSLNGLEYYIFAFALAILPISIIFIVKTVKFIYIKIKQVLKNN